MRNGQIRHDAIAWETGDGELAKRQRAIGNGPQ